MSDSPAPGPHRLLHEGPQTVRVPVADGVEVAAHRLAAGGAPLVLVHAAGLHGRVWAPLAARLSGTFACVAPDLRGHGESSPPPEGDLDWRGFAADVLAVVDGLGLVRPFGAGHSSGATALLLAEQERPGTFRALYCYEPVIVPADPPLGRDPHNWLAERTRRRRDRFASVAAALAHYRQRPPLSELDPDVLRAYVEHGFEDDGEGGVRLRCRPEHEALIYEMATAHDCFGRLADVACPVTVARGARSEAFCARHVGAMLERLPDGRSEEHPNLAHNGPLEDPAAIAAAIRVALVP